MDRPDKALLGLDLGRPSASRIYDYFLGGSQNFEVDRAVAREVIAMRPEVPMLARSNRAFLRRVVRYLVGEGVTQFLDIGSGIPTEGNVHEVARAVNPEVKVVYVDTDPVAVAHSRYLLGEDRHAVVVQADLMSPSEILDAPEVARLIDFDQPVGVLLFAVLHFVVDSRDPAGLIRRLGDALAPGSYLAVSHAGPDPDLERGERIDKVYGEAPIETALRAPEQIAPLFGPFELVQPGLVELSRWRPDNGPAFDVESEPVYGGVGKLPDLWDQG